MFSDIIDVDVSDIFYVKKCLGKGGLPIDVYKFRTMEHGADKRLDELVDGFDSQGHPLSDPRIIPFGKFLRKYWIDELPQLYNLARRDLKLVGIRPNSEGDWEKYPADIKEMALRQKPGLVGIQYAYPFTDSFEDHLGHLRDYLYLWEKNPIKTDAIYLTSIVKNIVLKGMRSS